MCQTVIVDLFILIEVEKQVSTKTFSKSLYEPMGDILVAIAPEVIVEIVKLLEQILKKNTEEQIDIKQELNALKMDMGIINDISNMIRKNNLKKLGIKAWVKEAANLVSNTSILLNKIENENSIHSQKRWSWNKKQRFHCSTDNMKQLKKLRTRCDNLSKHNETILKIIDKRPGTVGLLLGASTLGASVGMISLIALIVVL